MGRQPEIGIRNDFRLKPPFGDTVPLRKGQDDRLVIPRVIRHPLNTRRRGFFGTIERFLEKVG